MMLLAFQPAFKQTRIRADWSASMYTALVSNVMRTCKLQRLMCRLINELAFVARE